MELARLEAMASAVTFCVSSRFALNSGCRSFFRVRAQGNSGQKKLRALSSDLGTVNRKAAVSVEREEKLEEGLADGGNGFRFGFREMEKRGEEEAEEEEGLGPLWDDGYGSRTVKDYMEAAAEMIKPDGGPPRWFCPVECGRPLKDSPPLFFLPGKSFSTMFFLQFNMKRWSTIQY